jgi:hypothetical protein
MKTIYVHGVVVTILLSLSAVGFFLPIAKAQMPDSWLNLTVYSFNGDAISFNLQITVQGNHLADTIWIMDQIGSDSSQSGSSQSVGISSGVYIQIWRAIVRKIYSQDANTTLFSTDFGYSGNSPYYTAGPKIPLLNLLLFPADSHRLTLYLESSFNMTVDPRQTACQVSSQNYQGSVEVAQTSPDVFTANVLINHSESFFWGLSIILVTILASLYGLTAYLALALRKQANCSNIVTVSSAIIFFVPAFEIAFYSLKLPLPLVFSDILMIVLIPLNSIVISLALGMSPTKAVTKLKHKFLDFGHAMHRISKRQKQKSKSSQLQETN